MKHLPAEHNTPEARAERNRQWAELKEATAMKPKYPIKPYVRIEYVPHIMEPNTSQPRPMTDQEMSLYLEVMHCRPEQRDDKWKIFTDEVTK